LDWSAIEPSVFGTLFERGLDPSKRAQLGAHYTDPQSIMRLVQPVVVDRGSRRRAPAEPKKSYSNLPRIGGAREQCNNERVIFLRRPAVLSSWRWRKPAA
jgi:hypothetical protein